MINRQFAIQHETIVSTGRFPCSCKKCFRQGCDDYLTRTLFIVVPFTIQSSRVFKDCDIEVVWNLRLRRTQSIGVVILLIVDVNFNIGKIECKMMFTGVTRGTGVSCSSSAVVFSSTLAFSLCRFLNCFGIVSFVNTTFDKTQFQSEIHPSQFNVVVLIRLKFKLYAVFFE